MRGAVSASVVWILAASDRSSSSFPALHKASTIALSSGDPMGR
uniref:Uncharacterized protein n=1 Tax=Arundo donax TaxID=35708 RepID=A0A0A9BES3_ARUDO